MSSEVDSDEYQESWSPDSGRDHELAMDSSDNQDICPADSSDDIDRDDLTVSTNEDDSKSEELWCFCREPEAGQMIACDNDDCSIVWFHTDCLRLKRVPQGNWYCPQCTTKVKSTTCT